MPLACWGLYCVTRLTWDRSDFHAVFQSCNGMRCCWVYFYSDTSSSVFNDIHRIRFIDCDGTLKKRKHGVMFTGYMIILLFRVSAIRFANCRIFNYRCDTFARAGCDWAGGLYARTTEQLSLEMSRSLDRLWTQTRWRIWKWDGSHESVKESALATERAFVLTRRLHRQTYVDVPRWCWPWGTLIFSLCKIQFGFTLYQIWQVKCW